MDYTASFMYRTRPNNKDNLGPILPRTSLPLKPYSRSNSKSTSKRKAIAREAAGAGAKASAGAKIRAGAKYLKSDSRDTNSPIMI